MFVFEWFWGLLQKSFFSSILLFFDINWFSNPSDLKSLFCMSHQVNIGWSPSLWATLDIQINWIVRYLNAKALEFRSNWISDRLQWNDMPIEFQYNWVLNQANFIPFGFQFKWMSNQPAFKPSESQTKRIFHHLVECQKPLNFQSTWLSNQFNFNSNQIFQPLESEMNWHSILARFNSSEFQTHWLPNQVSFKSIELPAGCPPNQLHLNPIEFQILKSVEIQIKSAGLWINWISCIHTSFEVKSSWIPNAVLAEVSPA